ncbi:hypothetical protein LQW54_003621 [Pestalotiopsis sp. IQ-011]
MGWLWPTQKHPRKDPEKGFQNQVDERECRRTITPCLQPESGKNDNDMNLDDNVPFQSEGLLQYLCDLRQDIIDALSYHKSYSVEGGETFKDMPKFHDLARYGIGEEDEDKLWVEEVERLSREARSQSPPLLAGEICWSSQDLRDGYSRLHILAQQLNYALEICTHDNELLLMDHYPSEVNRLAYTNAYESSDRAFDIETQKVRYGRQLGVKEHNNEAIDALVDYITAIIVRILTRSISGDLWIKNTIVVLAKFSTKVKLLTKDLPKSFSKTLKARQELWDRLMVQQKRTGKTPEAFNILSEQGQDFDEQQRNYDKEVAGERRIFEDSYYAPEGQYFFEMARWGDHVGSLLKGSIRDLLVRDRPGQNAGEFESCAITNETELLEPRGPQG